MREIKIYKLDNVTNEKYDLYNGTSDEFITSPATFTNNTIFNNNIEGYKVIRWKQVVYSLKHSKFVYQINARNKIIFEMKLL